MIVWTLLIVGLILLALSARVPGPVSAAHAQVPSMAIVVHSFDGYQRYWQGFNYHWRKHGTRAWPTYFLTEELDPGWRPWIRCPKGASWSERLRFALGLLDVDVVLYLQEDMWLTGSLDEGAILRALARFGERSLKHMKVHGSVPGRLMATENLNDAAYYVASHQPGLWSRGWLIKTLARTEGPFSHETSVNRSIHSAGTLDSFETWPDAIVRYIDVSRRGKLRPEGARMLEAAGLAWKVEDHEVMIRDLS